MPEKENTIERTVAFFADHRASTLLLMSTITSLIASLEIQKGIVDVSTIPGLAISGAFQRAGVPYDVLDFGQQTNFLEQVGAPFDSTRAEWHRELAVGVTKIDVAELSKIDANVVLVPAMVGPGEKLIDFSQGSVIGTVVTQLEEAGRDFVLIDTPERGLLPLEDGSYQRAIIHVAESQGS